MLAADEGQSDSAIARGLAVNRKTVTLWRERFAREGLDSMWEVAPGRGRKPSYGSRKIAAIVSATLTTKLKGMTQWSCRQLAEVQGVSKSTVHNIWQSHQLQPHRDKTFKLSRDATFLEKWTDVVGLYLNPPKQALVLCVDEKTQNQALDRTQPGLPMKKGRCGNHDHDYKRAWAWPAPASCPLGRNRESSARLLDRRIGEHWGEAATPFGQMATVAGSRVCGNVRITSRTWNWKQGASTSRTLAMRRRRKRFRQTGCQSVLR